MLSVQTTQEKYYTAAITGHFRFVLEKKLEKENHIISLICHGFYISPFPKRFSSALKRKAGLLKFSRFEDLFRKTLFLVRISVDGWPNRRNKAAFLNFYRVMRRKPKTTSKGYSSSDLQTSKTFKKVFKCCRLWWTTRLATPSSQALQERNIQTNITGLKIPNGDRTFGSKHDEELN